MARNADCAKERRMVRVSFGNGPEESRSTSVPNRGASFPFLEEVASLRVVGCASKRIETKVSAFFRFCGLFGLFGPILPSRLTGELTPRNGDGL